MKQKIMTWAAPLVIFLGGELLFLFFLLFMPAIDTGIAVAANVTANVSSTFWGWGWVTTPGVGRSVVIVAFQAAIIITAGIAFLRSAKSKS